MAPTKNKKIPLYLFSALLFGIFFILSVSYSPQVFAADASNVGTLASLQVGEPSSDNVFITGVKWLLYALLWMLTGLVQVAASVFAWATKPEYISGPTGLLNLDSVYTLWKFIRDFFNLFFIFLLLFSAFATVFQVEKFSLKKNFFKIVGAAIAINFSFPLTRIIIDLGNVPMYFFADGLVSSAASGGNALYSIPSAFFQSSQMASLLTPQSNSSTLTSLLSAVIFTFIFMITLFTLAMLFVIRLLKLVILLIFSPVGLAASIIPGLEKFGKQWWSQLFQTVFFGPAAMLMIVIALRFTLELNNTAFTDGLGATASSANASSQSSIIAQGLFFIPIILMWMAMHMGSKFGIEGASAVIKRADKVAGWGKKQLLFGKGSLTRRTVAAAPGAARIRGIGAGIKSKYEDKISNPLKSQRETEEARGKAMAKGLLTREKGSYKKAMLKADAELLDKRAREQEKKWKDGSKPPSEILDELRKQDNYNKDGTPKANALAAANFLSNEKDAIRSSEDLTKILEIAGQTKKKDLYNKALNAATDDSLSMDPAQLDRMKEAQKSFGEYTAPKREDFASETDYRRAVHTADEEFKEKFLDKVKTKFKKEGKIKTLINYEIEENRKNGSLVSKKAVYDKYMDKMKAKEIAQMQDIYDDRGELDGEVVAHIQGRKWNNKMLQDAYSELDGKKQAAWMKAGLKPEE